MTKSTFLALAILAILLTACAAGATDTPLPIQQNTSSAASVSFSNDVMPILQSRCATCHGGNQTNAGLSFASYETLMAGSNNGPVVTPGNPANSLLIQMIQEGRMPKRGPKLTPDQLQILMDWIQSGALNN
jgi:uncharacterized membrane protein